MTKRTIVKAQLFGNPRFCEEYWFVTYSDGSRNDRPFNDPEVLKFLKEDDAERKRIREEKEAKRKKEFESQCPCGCGCVGESYDLFTNESSMARAIDDMYSL